MGILIAETNVMPQAVESLRFEPADESGGRSFLILRTVSGREYRQHVADMYEFNALVARIEAAAVCPPPGPPASLPELPRCTKCGGSILGRQVTIAQGKNAGNYHPGCAA